MSPLDMNANRSSRHVTDATTKRTSMRRWLIAGVVPLLTLAALAGSAEAQEIQLTGPLAGAPAVRHERLYREGRFELALTTSFTLLDQYNRTMFVGGRLQYNITDWLSLGGWGALGVLQTPTDLSDQINNTAPRASQTAVNIPPKGGSFVNQIGQMQWVAVPQLQLTPFRGKLAIFQKIFVNADAYLHGGPAFVGVSERADCGSTGEPSCSDSKSFTRASRTAITGSFGLGFNFYIGQFLSLNAEYRALPFSWNQSGFDTSGGPPNGNFPDNKVNSSDRTFKFNQMITLGLGFSFAPRSNSLAPIISE